MWENLCKLAVRTGLEGVAEGLAVCVQVLRKGKERPQCQNRQDAGAVARHVVVAGVA